MDTYAILIGALGLLLAGPVSYVVTKRASEGAIGVNSVVGIRTKTTKSSPDAWKVAHRAALPWVGAAAATAVAGAVISVALTAAVILIAGYVGLVALLLIATSVANSAVRAADHPEDR